MRRLSKLISVAAVFIAVLSATSSPARASALRESNRPLTLQGLHSEPLHPLSDAVGSRGIGGHGIGPNDAIAHNAVSSNWAGLVDTGTTFTGIAATWTVPTVKPSIPLEVAGTWIGIDGDANDPYPGIIQTGTVQASGDGQTLYDAWYELLPQPPVYLGWTVNPGDEMHASITKASLEHWSLTISDVGSGQTFSSAFFYPGPGLSAEWIEEAPGNASSQAVPPDFGSVTFSNLYVAGANLGQVLVEPWDFQDPFTGQVAAVSSGLQNDDSVTVVYSEQGYDLATSDGDVFSFGIAPYLGSMAGIPLSQPAVAMADDDATGGYWLVGSDGGIFTFDAPFYGSMGGIPLNRPIVGMAGDPQTGGYWEVASDGGIFAFNAPFLGSMGGTRLNQPVVGMAPTPDGNGYWLVASDGGIFAFGDAGFSGSMGGTRLDQPVVGMATDSSTGGYWLVASDGGIFSFNAPFFGSMGGSYLSQPIVGMSSTHDAGGYWLVASDGGIFAFGDAGYLGSQGGGFLPAPVVGMAAAG